MNEFYEKVRAFALWEMTVEAIKDLGIPIPYTDEDKAKGEAMWAELLTFVEPGQDDKIRQLVDELKRS